MHLPEFEDDYESNAELVHQYLSKLADYDAPVNLRADDPNSFLNTFRKNYEYSIAVTQQHFSIKIKDCSIIEFFTYQKILDKKVRARTSKPGSGTIH